MAHFIRGNIPTTPEEIARWLSTNQGTQSAHGIALTVSEGAFSTNNNKYWTMIGQVKDQDSVNVSGIHLAWMWSHQKDDAIITDIVGPVPSNGTLDIHPQKVYFGSLATATGAYVLGCLGATDSTGKMWMQWYIHSGNMQVVGGANKAQSVACYAALQGTWGDVKQATFVASNA